VGSGENVIAVVYKNTGQATAYQAQGRISVVSPFSSSDTNSYIGDIAPGEEKTAYYKIKVASDATPKDYSLDSEIRYTDSENNNYVSDTVKVIVSYQESAPTGTIIIIVLVIVIAGAGYYLYSRKKNN
ncbi:MAG: S-layer protein, partial [Methanomicrobium sp.]|nr:S-layer protein [Methanomicrobium sp.]